MILKYALFTLTVSLIPVLVILKDMYSNFDVSVLYTSLGLGLTENLDFEFINNILFSGIFTYFFVTNYDSALERENQPEILFTKETLKEFNGRNGKSLYLAILGNVFDVSKAAKYYGPGETYNAFTGRDGSRAFVTGDFTEKGLTDVVDDLSFQDLRSLNDWLKFYHKEYTYKGKLVGRYYDENGRHTSHSHILQIKMKEAEKDEEDKNRFKLMFPPCNVEWTPEEGSRVWCTKRSGGIERDWVGVPRKLYEPGADTFRCACINEVGQSQVITPETGKVRSRNIEEYEDCHPKSSSCLVHN